MLDLSSTRTDSRQGSCGLLKLGDEKNDKALNRKLTSVATAVVLSHRDIIRIHHSLTVMTEMKGQISVHMKEKTEILSSHTV